MLGLANQLPFALQASLQRCWLPDCFIRYANAPV
jgi:hypothetical protein